MNTGFIELSSMNNTNDFRFRWTRSAGGAMNHHRPFGYVVMFHLSPSSRWSQKKRNQSPSKTIEAGFDLQGQGVFLTGFSYDLYGENNS